MSSEKKELLRLNKFFSSFLKANFKNDENQLFFGRQVLDFNKLVDETPVNRARISFSFFFFFFFF